MRVDEEGTGERDDVGLPGGEDALGLFGRDETDRANGEARFAQARRAPAFLLVGVVSALPLHARATRTRYGCPRRMVADGATG